MASISAPSLALSGLASGVDTSGIVQQLMAVDQQSLNPITFQQARVTAHQSGLKAISDALNALQSAGDALKDPATWKATQSSASSNASVGVSLLSGAGIGGHTIQVDRLASSAQHGYAFTPSATARSFDVYYGTDPNATGASKVTINVAANATAADVATAINAQDAAPVYAAAITDPTTGQQRLVLSARKTGQSSDFKLDTTNMAAGQLTEDASYARTGTVLNALYKVDGAPTAASSESNVLDNAIPGLRLTLKGVTSSAATVTTSAANIDQNAISTKVQNFVNAYNNLVDLANRDMSQKKVVNPQSASDASQGALFGDLGLQSMLSTVRNQLTSTLGGVGTLKSLADIGVSVPSATGAAPSDDALAGKLSFDSTKLTSSLNTDWTQVRNLFTGVGTTKGFSANLDDYVKSMTGANGILTQQQNADGSSLTDLQSQLAQRNTQLQNEQARLTAQFAAMETALQNSQTQQQWLTAQLGSL
jgi:flagellar hook-associated protein 2